MREHRGRDADDSQPDRERQRSIRLDERPGEEREAGADHERTRPSLRAASRGDEARRDERDAGHDREGGERRAVAPKLAPLDRSRGQRGAGGGGGTDADHDRVRAELGAGRCERRGQRSEPQRSWLPPSRIPATHETACMSTRYRRRKSRAGHTAVRGRRQARSSHVPPRAHRRRQQRLPRSGATAARAERLRRRRRGRERQPGLSRRRRRTAPIWRSSTCSYRTSTGSRSQNGFPRLDPAPRVILTSSLDGIRFRGAGGGQPRARLHSQSATSRPRDRSAARIDPLRRASVRSSHAFPRHCSASTSNTPIRSRTRRRLSASSSPTTPCFCARASPACSRARDSRSSGRAARPRICC